MESNKGKYLAGYLAGLTTSLIVAVVAMLFYAIVMHRGVFSTERVGDVAVQKNEEIDTSKNEILNKIAYLSGIIETYYLEEVDAKDIVEGIYKGIFSSLGDPYSVYYTAEEYNELNNHNNGQFVGIGVVVKIKDNSDIYVESFLEGGNARESGLKEGDVIIKVDDKLSSDYSFDEIVNFIKGEEGTTVSITVKRAEDGVYKEYTYDIKRALVDNISVTSKMLDDDIGYIHISGYEANTAGQFKDCLNQLKEQGMKGLILDERMNGGGLLTSVTQIADCLMDEGVLVTTRDKNGKVTKEVNTTDDTMLDVPLVVLVDGHSASASEVLAAAVKDRNVGKLVGVKTYGKGIVQSIIPLNDGSAVKVTTERYYTPAGDFIHGVGIEPDIVVELDKEQAQKGIDTQQEKAIEVIKEMIEENE